MRKVGEHVAWMLALALVGCGGAQSSPGPAASGVTQIEQPAGTATRVSGDAPVKANSPEDSRKLDEDQKAQLEIALRRGAAKAAKCGDVVPDAARGKGDVKVTFDGRKGRITDAVVGAPWAGTPVESCIKRAFVGEIVLPFDGDPLAVPYTVEIR